MTWFRIVLWDKFVVFEYSNSESRKKKEINGWNRRIIINALYFYIVYKFHMTL